jgi:hypothetical protein
MLAKAENFPKSNVLQEIAQEWTEKNLYSFMSSKG